MVRTSVGGVLVAAVFAASPAVADDAATRVDPLSLLDRPLLLPRWTVQAELAGASGVHASPSGEGSGLYSEVALSVGLPLDAQLGAYWRQASGQTAEVMFNLQRAFGPFVAARADFGLSSSISAVEPGLTFGVGAPLRYRFDEHFALVSGRTEGRAFGSASGDGDQATYTPSEDLLTIRQVNAPCAEFSARSGPGAPNFETACGAGWFGTVGLPVGLLFQPRAGVALSFRTGVRYSFAIDGFTSPVAGALPLFIPIAVEGSFTPWSHLDLGLTAQAAGIPTSLAANRSVVLWTQVRL